MKKSNKTFIKKIIVFVLGLTNLIPSEFSIYDKWIIPVIEGKITPSDPFYWHIEFLIILIRLLIIVVTAYEAHDIINRLIVRKN